MATRTAIYVRISDARDGDTAGVDRQEKDCRKLCRDRGWAVDEFYCDNDTSAMTKPLGKRKDGARLLAAIEAGDINRVVVWHTSRLLRDRADRIANLGLFEKLRVAIIPVKGTELDLHSASGRMVANMLGEIDAYESELKGERVSRAHEEAAIQGKFAGGRRRMGYSKSADELHPDEAPEIRWAYEHVAAGGTLESVVRRWRKSLGNGPLGGVITGVQVRDVLLRPMNAGLSFYKGAEVGKMDEAVPRIIDEDTWRTVHAILMDPARRTGKVGKPPKTLLTSVLKCAQCGGRMNARHRRDAKSDRKDPVYACREGHVSRHRQRMDDAVTELVLDYLAQHADRLRVPAPSQAEAPAAVEAAELRARLDALSQLVAAGEIDPADYAMASRRVRERLEGIEARLVRASARPATMALLGAEDVPAAWKAASIETQRTVVAELIERITVSRNKPGPFTMRGVDVQWRYGQTQEESS